MNWIARTMDRVVVAIHFTHLARRLGGRMAISNIVENVCSRTRTSIAPALVLFSAHNSALRLETRND